MKTVNEVCKAAGVTRKTLYYYDKIDLLKPVKRSGKQKAKLYSDSAVDTLKMIRQYQEAGLLLSEVRTILNQPEKTIEILLNAQKRLFEQKQMLSEQILLLTKLIEEEKSSL
ncbi:MAG: MerR family transcriptional regulator [Solobacterium sp.]|nr:MerR family transcriptional regulator [Solobacterium sp.]